MPNKLQKVSDRKNKQKNKSKPKNQNQNKHKNQHKHKNQNKHKNQHKNKQQQNKHKKQHTYTHKKKRTQQSSVKKLQNKRTQVTMCFHHDALLPPSFLPSQNPPPPTLQLLCISCRSSSGSGPHAFKHSAHPGELRWVLHYNQANDYKTEACFPLPPPPSPLLSSFLPFCLGFSCSLFTSLHTLFRKEK